MVKTCSKCKKVKDFSEFFKAKKGKYGLRGDCKTCGRQSFKKWREANKERRKEYQKANKERKKEYDKKWYEANKERKKEYRKKWYEDNKERMKEYRKKWDEDNKERIKEYVKKRRKTDSLYKLKKNLRNRTYQAFKNKGYKKTSKTQEMLGVDWEVAKQHIERQFKKGMSWDNYGDWHIDHIIPLASANTEKRLKELCHYTNLQPLWAEENLIKSASINNQQTRMRI